MYFTSFKLSIFRSISLINFAAGDQLILPEHHFLLNYNFSPLEPMIVITFHSLIHRYRIVTYRRVKKTDLTKLSGVDLTILLCLYLH